MDKEQKIKEFFWNCEDVDLEDGLTYREVNHTEFDNLMEEMYGDGIYDIEAVVLNLDIGFWSDCNIEQGVSLIELFHSFVVEMSE